MIKGPILHLILVDSELEIVPKTYWSHPAVVTNSRKRGKKSSRVLLDSSLHHSLFKDPQEKKRRGRPDIVHQFLLLGLDSIINSEQLLKLYVHTRNDELINIDPSTRFPKNYNRYCGLFEELFRAGAVPSKANPLITIKGDMDLPAILDQIKSLSVDEGRRPVVIGLDQGGIRVDLLKHLPEVHDGGGDVDLIFLIGGFAHGDLRSDVSSLSDEIVSISDDLLKVWAVQMDLMVCFHHSIPTLTDRR
ncbi:MAG: 16S rRNA methyltransferase [Thermoplasmata archaeon]|nr:16S rRNA methyltransferase [Thermoplasmata archaeon]